MDILEAAHVKSSYFLIANLSAAFVVPNSVILFYTSKIQGHHFIIIDFLFLKIVRLLILMYAAEE
jgi:hypothetical protein